MGHLKSVSDSLGDDVALLLILTQVAVALVIGYNIFFVRPAQPPPADVLKGCYTSLKAPSIHFQNGFLVVAEHGWTPVRYRFELQKYGTLSITTEPAIRAQPANFGRYSFVRGDSKFLFDMMPAHLVNGKVYPVLKLRDMGFIDVTATDGHQLLFNLASEADCEVH